MKVKKSLLVLALATLALILLPASAFADSISITCSSPNVQCSGGTYTVDLSITGDSSNWTIDFKLTGTSGGTFTGFGINNAFTSALDSPVISVSPSGTAVVNVGFNNGNASCTGVGGDLCLSDSVAFTGSVEYIIHVSGGGTLQPTGDWTVQANIKNASGNGNLLALSTGAAGTPEPGSMALLGAGILGLAGMFRRRR